MKRDVQNLNRELIIKLAKDAGLKIEKVGIDAVERLVQATVEECISSILETAKTMRENGLYDSHCGPHSYNFEIREKFGMLVIKDREDSESDDE